MITVIVLLILAMVSINLVMNGGIIDKSKNAVDKYSQEEVQEQIKLAYSEWQTAQFTGETRTAEQFITARLQETFENENVKNVLVTNRKIAVEIKTRGEFIKYSYNLEKGVVGIVEDWKQNQDGSYSRGSTSGLRVGHIVHYETELAKTANAVNDTKKTQLISDLETYSGTSFSHNSEIDRENLTWKVLDIKDGKIRLISSAPTTKNIKLNGYNGYNNGVYLIDEACDTLYSIDGVGKAQNLKIEDIEEKINTSQFDYT